MSRDSNSILIFDPHAPDVSLEMLDGYFRGLTFEPEYGPGYKLDKWDWRVAALLGMLGGVADLVIGRPGGYSEPKMQWAKDFDPSGSPIDYQEIPGISRGDHRLYSNGHDLCRLGQTIGDVTQKEFTGWAPGGGVIGAHLPDYADLSPGQAVVGVGAHLWKDFWTSRSLPIPGSSFLPHLYDEKMPQVIHDSYREGLNLQTLVGQAISIAICEIGVRIHVSCRKHFSQEYLFPESKKTRMLIIAHTVALAFNVGKVIATENPLFLNWSQIALLMRHLVKFVLERFEHFNKIIELSGDNNNQMRELILSKPHLIGTLSSMVGTNMDLIVNYDEMINQGIGLKEKIAGQERKEQILLDEQEKINHQMRQIDLKIKEIRGGSKDV